MEAGEVGWDFQPRYLSAIMLKCLAILCFIAGVEVAFGGQSPTVGVNPCGEQKQVEEGNAHKGSDQYRVTPDCPLIVDVKKAEPSKKDADEEKAENDRKKFIETWTFYLAVAVAVTAILQVVGIGFQIAIFRKQTALMTGALAAAQSSAEAAKLNAQAIINSERPWLLIVIKPVMGPMGGFNVHVRNRGRTPAMITAAHIGCEAVKSISGLPNEPRYTSRNLVQDRIVMPDGAARIIWFDSGTLHRMLDGRFPQFSWEGEVYIFGTVLYRDLLNPSPTELHETRWIGRYQGVVGELGDSIFRFEGIGVADEYHRYT